MRVLFVGLVALSSCTYYPMCCSSAMLASRGLHAGGAIARTPQGLNRTMTFFDASTPISSVSRIDGANTSIILSDGAMLGVCPSVCRCS